MDYARKYIEELRSSTALMRKFAARYLRTYGDERAFRPLLEACADAEPEVRAEAAETLGRIGDRTVLPGLLQACEDGDERVRRAAETACRDVRNRHPASEEAPAAPPEPPAEPSPALRRALLDRALEDMGAAVEERKYGYKIRVPLLRGRQQVVRVVYDRSDPEGDPLLLIFTLCGPADAKLFRWALRMNVHNSYGCLALWKGRGEGEERFILLERLLESDTTAEELRKAVATVAEKGDLIEKKLTGADEY